MDCISVKYDGASLQYIWPNYGRSLIKIRPYCFSSLVLGNLTEHTLLYLSEIYWYYTLWNNHSFQHFLAVDKHTPWHKIMAHKFAFSNIAGSRTTHVRTQDNYAAHIQSCSILRLISFVTWHRASSGQITELDPKTNLHLVLKDNINLSRNVVNYRLYKPHLQSVTLG